MLTCMQSEGYDELEGCEDYEGTRFENDTSLCGKALLYEKSSLNVQTFLYIKPLFNSIQPNMNFLTMRK